jgi:hypothetical protein
MAHTLNDSYTYSCSSVVAIVFYQQSGDLAFPVHSRIVVSETVSPESPYGRDEKMTYDQLNLSFPLLPSIHDFLLFTSDIGHVPIVAILFPELHVIASLCDPSFCISNARIDELGMLF